MYICGRTVVHLPAADRSAAAMPAEEAWVEMTSDDSPRSSRIRRGNSQSATPASHAPRSLALCIYPPLATAVAVVAVVNAVEHRRNVLKLCLGILHQAIFFSG